jgi:hypothetical protein
MGKVIDIFTKKIISELPKPDKPIRRFIMPKRGALVKPKDKK